ncbi:MAG: PAS domain S-box protein [Methanomicrobiales archaeon]|nr:PAS domain S-box protein [Methanomicrobiales archaeon]
MEERFPHCRERPVTNPSGIHQEQYYSPDTCTELFIWVRIVIGTYQTISMKLQEKTSLILILLLIFSITIISVVVSVISLSSYRNLEEDYVARDVSLALNKLGDESDTLSAIASDWGPWDDTYHFVLGTKPEYVQANLLPETYPNLRLSLILIVNERAEILYGGAYDPATHTVVDVPASLLEHIRPGSPLMRMDNPRTGTDGILITPEGPMIVASRPIVHTDFSGTPVGVVIMGRYLSTEEVARLAYLTDPSLSFVDMHDPSLPPGVQERLHESPGATTPVIQVLSDDKVAGYALIRDIYGNDSLVLRINQYRDIYRQGITTTLHYILIVLAAGLFLGIAALFMLDRLVLSRIMDLSRQVSGIGKAPGASPRVSFEGNDEFAQLAFEINQMLDTIDQARNGLLASEARFRELAQLLPQTIFEMDMAGRLLYVNEAATATFGITAGMIQKGVNVREYLIPQDHGRMQTNLAAVLGGIKSTGQIYSLHRADGSLMRAIVNTAPILREGAVAGFRGIVIDVTDRVNLEEALTESQEYLETLLMSIKVGIVVIDSETHTIVDANPAALEMIGTTRDQLINLPCQNVICPAGPGECPVTDQNLMLDNCERSLITKSGATISVIKYVVPVMLHGRSCLLETFIDNTARKQIEAELRESRERLSGILRASPVGVFETTPDGTLVYVNERWEEMTGVAHEAAQGKRWTDTLHPLDRERVGREVQEKIHSHQIPRAEARFIRPDKTIIWVYGQAVPLYDSEGKIRGYAGTITDITDRKRDEDAVQLANKKLNLMNNITRHDILNTITGLLGCVDMAKATVSADERESLLNEIKNLTRLIQRQIAFTKEYQEVGVRLPVWQNVNEVISRIRQSFTSAEITIVIELEDMEIYADPLLEKVFYNLVDNAIRYGEHISMISFFFQVSDKGLFIICQDDGAGIPPDAKVRIFERGVGRNTGMGLFLSREILGITGITIEETGVFGNGARFEILIPRGTFRFIRK